AGSAATDATNRITATVRLPRIGRCCPGRRPRANMRHAFDAVAQWRGGGRASRSWPAVAGDGASPDRADRWRGDGARRTAVAVAVRMERHLAAIRPADWQGRREFGRADAGD